MEGKPVCSKCLKTHWVDEACKEDERAGGPVVPAIQELPSRPGKAAGQDDGGERPAKFDRSAAMKASWARRKSGAQDPSP